MGLKMDQKLNEFDFYNMLFDVRKKYGIYIDMVNINESSFLMLFRYVDFIDYEIVLYDDRGFRSHSPTFFIDEGSLLLPISGLPKQLISSSCVEYVCKLLSEGIRGKEDKSFEILKKNYDQVYGKKIA